MASKITYDRNRAKECLEFVIDFWGKHYFSPSTREIADHLKTSTSVVNYYLLQLENDGYILERTEGNARMIIPKEVEEAIRQYFDDKYLES